MPYNKTEDSWSKEFSWFLVDNGEIQYAFKDQESALKYLNKAKIDYWLLTNLENITHDTMLDPNEFRSWNNKIQTCIEILK